MPARLSDGTPLLLEKQIGEGHVLLLTSGLENLTNDLPLHPVFVTFVDHAGALPFRERAARADQAGRFVRTTSWDCGAGGRSSERGSDRSGWASTTFVERSAERAELPTAPSRFLSDSFCEWARCGHWRKSRPARVGSCADPGGCAKALERELRRRGSAGSGWRGKIPSLEFMVVRYAACIGSGGGADGVRQPYMGTQREEV